MDMERIAISSLNAMAFAFLDWINSDIHIIVQVNSCLNNGLAKK